MNWQVGQKRREGIKKPCLRGTKRKMKNEKRKKRKKMSLNKKIIIVG